jgi:hypothetical protein
MKEAYLRAMRQQFPGELLLIGGVVGMAPGQHRDTVRTFALGVHLAIHGCVRNAADKETALLNWQDVFGVTFNDAWWPDSTWKWW